MVPDIQKSKPWFQAVKVPDYAGLIFPTWIIPRGPLSLPLAHPPLSIQDDFLPNESLFMCRPNVKSSITPQAPLFYGRAPL